MFSFSKSVLIGTLGIGGGIGATTYGLLNAKSSSDFLKWEKRQINNITEPVIFCANGYDEYKATMTLSEDGLNNMGFGITLVFKIQQFDNTKTELKESYIRKWGQQASSDNKHDWKAWKVRFSDNGKVHDFTYEDYDTNVRGNRLTTDSMINGCSKSKIEFPKWKEEKRSVDGIENKDISFTIDKNLCLQTSNSVTCGVKIVAKDADLEWSKDFNPTITFSK